MKSGLNPPRLESRVVSIYHLHFPAHRPSSIALCARAHIHGGNRRVNVFIYLNGGEFTNFFETRYIFRRDSGTRLRNFLNEYLASIIHY